MYVFALKTAFCICGTGFVLLYFDLSARLSLIRRSKTKVYYNHSLAGKSAVCRILVMMFLRGARDAMVSVPSPSTCIFGNSQDSGFGDVCGLSQVLYKDYQKNLSYNQIQNTLEMYSNTMHKVPQLRAYHAWQLEKLREQDLDMPYIHEPVPGRNALSLSEAAHLDALDYVAMHPGQNVHEVQKTFEQFRSDMPPNQLQKMDYMINNAFKRMPGSSREGGMLGSSREGGMLGSSREGGMLGSYREGGMLGSYREGGMLGSYREGNAMHTLAATPSLTNPPARYRPNDESEWYYDYMASQTQDGIRRL